MVIQRSTLILSAQLSASNFLSYDHVQSYRDWPGYIILVSTPGLIISTVALLFGKTTGSKLSLTIRETEKLHHVYPSPTMNVLSVMLQRTKLRGILVIRTSPSRSMSLPMHNFSYSVFDVKRLIGRKFDDPMVQSDLKYFTFKVFDKRGKPYIHVKHRCERKELVCIHLLHHKTNLSQTWT